MWTRGPMASGDPYWSAVQSIYSMEDSSGGDTLANAKGGVATREGAYTADVDTSADKVKFGARALAVATKLAGASYSFIQNCGDVSLGADNLYTVEGWLWWTGHVDSRVFVSGIYDTNIAEIASIKFYTTNQLDFYSQLSGTHSLIINLSSLGKLNAWIHVANTYDGTTKRAFIDGVEVGSAAVNAGAVRTARYSRINCGSSGNAFAPTAYIDETRNTLGVCRYNANFTPPASPFPRG